MRRRSHGKAAPAVVLAQLSGDNGAHGAECSTPTPAANATAGSAAPSMAQGSHDESTVPEAGITSLATNTVAVGAKQCCLRTRLSPGNNISSGDIRAPRAQQEREGESASPPAAEPTEPDAAWRPDALKERFERVFLRAEDGPGASGDGPAATEATLQPPAGPRRLCGRSSAWCSSTGFNRRLSRSRDRACRARSAQGRRARTARARERWAAAAARPRRPLGPPAAPAAVTSVRTSHRRARDTPAPRGYASHALPRGVLCASRPLGVPGRTAAGASRGPGSNYAPLATPIAHTHSHGTLRSSALSGHRDLEHASNVDQPPQRGGPHHGRPRRGRWRRRRRLRSGWGVLARAMMAVRPSPFEAILACLRC